MAGVGVVPETTKKQSENDKGETTVVDYKNLPCPIPYEELHRQGHAMMILHPELFDGFRFDFLKPLNQKFILSHSVTMGPMTVPSPTPQLIKIPAATYEFGANFIDHPKCLLVGRLLLDGTLNARAQYDLTDSVTMKFQSQLTNHPHMSHGIVNFDYKGSDYRAQIQMGNGTLFGASYIQSVTPHLSLGGDVFWTGQQRKSGVSCGARFNNDKMVATGQVSSTGILALNYVQKVSARLSLASDFAYNCLSKDVTASVGYEYVFRQSHVRGKIDTNGRTAAFLEERTPMGLKIVFSAEIDHKKKDYRFGYGLSVGE